jgi:putative transposase
VGRAPSLDGRAARSILAARDPRTPERGGVQRRTNVVRIFPNEPSLLRLGTALAIERNEQWLERRYLDPEGITLITITLTPTQKAA